MAVVERLQRRSGVVLVERGPRPAQRAAQRLHLSAGVRLLALPLEIGEPGVQILQRAADLGVGRVSVREGIRLLTGGGYLTVRRGAGGGTFVQGESHEMPLARSAFRSVRVENIYVQESWSIDEIVGFVFSTSFANKTLLGAKAGAFEAEWPTRATEALLEIVQYRSLQVDLERLNGHDITRDISLRDGMHVADERSRGEDN